MSSLWPLQVAAVTRLKAYSALAALIGSKVFDGIAPQGTALPYVVISSSSETDSRTLERAGWTDTITMTIWAAAGRQDAIAAIIVQMDAALSTPLTVSGFGVTRMRREMNETLNEPPDRFGRAVRYRAFALASA